jgi:hypothetical protein
LYAAVDWLLVALCVIVYGLLIGEAAGIVRQLLRMHKRVQRLAESRMFQALPQAEASFEKLSNAVFEVEALAARAASAVALVRSLVRGARALTGRSRP